MHNKEMNMHMRDYDTWLTDPIDVEYEIFCREGDVNPIKDPSEAVYGLLEEIFEGYIFNEHRTVNAMKCLAKHFKIDVEKVDFDNPNITGKGDIIEANKKSEARINEIKQFVLRHAKDLEDQLCGEGEIDLKSVRSSLKNILWMAGQISYYGVEDKKITIKRG